MERIDEISRAVISLLRLGAVLRFIFCMIRLQNAEEEAPQYKKRAKNILMFYILAESIWQIKEIVFYYYYT